MSFATIHRNNDHILYDTFELNIQKATDAYELFEMLHKIKIQIRINPEVLVANNGYMNDNIIKYTYENNIQLLIPNRTESSKSKLKNDDNPYAKAKFNYEWKTDSFISPMGEHPYYKNDRKLNGEYMRVYSTNKCKTFPVKNICTQRIVRELFEPIDDLRWKIKADFKTPEGKIYYKKKSKSKRSTVRIT